MCYWESSSDCSEGDLEYYLVDDHNCFSKGGHHDSTYYQNNHWECESSTFDGLSQQPFRDRTHLHFARLLAIDSIHAIQMMVSTIIVQLRGTGNTASSIVLKVFPFFVDHSQVLNCRGELARESTPPIFQLHMSSSI